MTPEDQADLAESLVPIAGRLIAAVHDDGPGMVARLLSEVPAAHLPALCVVLAAHGDPELSSSEALSWVYWDDAPRTPAEPLFGPVDGGGDVVPFRRVESLRASVLAAHEWPDDECKELHAAWRRRQNGNPDPEGDPGLERAGFREYDRRRTAARRAADNGTRERHNAAERDRKARRRAQERA